MSAVEWYSLCISFVSTQDDSKSSFKSFIIVNFMKKIFLPRLKLRGWLIAMFIYLLTSSSLIHASTMGIFAMNHTSHTHSSHCHSETSTTQKSSTSNMNCCELFTSSQYSQVSLEFKTSLKNFQHTILEITKKPRLLTLQTFDFWPNFSPWWQTSLGKYNKFSDLSGIIKKTI